MPLEGERLGSYRLLRLLGSGGMGEVYLAEDARVGQQVAIKVIRSEGTPYPESTAAKEAARLFDREAKAIARLDHPHILPLYAYGEETLHEQLLTYLVMPYRKEGTLANWLRRRDSATLLTPVEVVPLLYQAAQALHHAHQQQVIHQDVKPTNFLIRLRDEEPDQPDLLLADFGIAKLTSATASASQSIRGTPTYMAPEQWEGHPVPATDQYALAIMVYELLVGRPPFQGGPGQMMRQHYQTPPQAPSMLNSQLSPAIDAVLLRALAKQPEERFPSVTAFSQAFQEAAQSDGELRATLAISRAEAVVGNRRSLTLPDGRRVSVSVPAGVRDGSILRLEGQGWPVSQGGPVGPLVLTIRIVSVEQALALSQESIVPTFPVSLPTASSPSGQDTRPPAGASNAQAHLSPTMPASNESSVAPTILAAQASTPPTEEARPVSRTALPAHMARSSTSPSLPSEAMVVRKAAKPRASQRFVLLGLAGLVVVALASGLLWLAAHQPGSVTEFPIPTANSGLAEIAAGPDGNLWFIEENGNKIGRLSPGGTITEFPIHTLQSFSFGITAGPDGNLWFTEQNHGVIGRISPNGTIAETSLLTTSTSNDPIPVGIAAGPDGNLWYAERLGNSIGRINPSGTFTEFSVPTPQSSPYGITAGPDGNLWFTEYSGNKIGRISPSGTFTEFSVPTAKSSPLNITAGPDGNLWFTEYSGNKIGRISPSGTITEFPVPTAKSSPLNITAGPDGNLWFTEYSGNKIGRISPSGTFTEFSVPTAKSSPEGITAGSDGNLWFTEAKANKIGRITSGK